MAGAHSWFDSRDTYVHNVNGLEFLKTINLKHMNNKLTDVSPPGHTGHMMRYLHGTKKTLHCTVTTTDGCEACKLLKQVEEAKEKEQDRYRLAEAEELLCDKCSSILGYVYSGDLNGSHFYCRNCKQDKDDKTCPHHCKGCNAGDLDPCQCGSLH